MKRRVLIVEDNPDLAYGLKNNLEIEGYLVEIATDGSAGLDRARRGGYALVILDLMLPGIDGIQVLRSIRERDQDMPILVLTARGEETDKVQCLRFGADDYVTKPFGVMELVARVEALLRRSSSRDRTRIERFGAFELDVPTRTLRRNGEVIDLTPKEFDLLLALIDRRGAVVSRSDLLEEVWGYPASVVTRTVDTHIAELRRKIEEDPSTPRHILTSRKAGYRLQP